MRTVGRWQERYVSHGVAGLRRDATRRGRKLPLTAEVIALVVEKTGEDPAREAGGRSALERAQVGQGGWHQLH